MAAFISATDADSEGEEGKFFVWSPDEIESLALGNEDADTVQRILRRFSTRVTSRERTYLNIPVKAADFAERQGVPLEQLVDRHPGEAKRPCG